MVLPLDESAIKAVQWGVSIAEIGVGQPPEWVGAKAVGLWKLASAGLVVPKAYVVSGTADTIHLPWKTSIVRSSSNLEDQFSAAGLFPSYGPITQEAEVRRRVQDVLSARLSDVVIAFCDWTGVEPTTVKLASIVQEWVEGDALIAYSRNPYDSNDDIVLLSQSGKTNRISSESRIGTFVRQIESLWGTPVDVEFVLKSEEPVVLQARTLKVLEGQAGRFFGKQEGGQTEIAGHWCWDVFHNPLPLSPAQRSLVELVVEKKSPSMRVIDGYLYQRGPREKAGHQRSVRQESECRIEKLHSVLTSLDGIFAQSAVEFRDELSRFCRFVEWYRSFTAIVANPAENEVAEFYEVLSRELDTNELLPTTWDVKDASLRPWSCIPFPPQRTKENWWRWLCQIDDVFFLRAQKRIRKAFLREGERLGIGEDVFWVPLTRLLKIDGIYSLQETMQKEKEDYQQRSQKSPPLEYLNGTPVFESPENRIFWCGTVGRGDFVGRGTTDLEKGEGILLSRGLTPSQVPFLKRFNGVLIEDSDEMGHAATLLRYLDVPHVLGCVGITKTAGSEIRVVKGKLVFARM